MIRYALKWDIYVHLFLVVHCWSTKLGSLTKDFLCKKTLPALKLWFFWPYLKKPIILFFVLQFWPILLNHPNNRNGRAISCPVMQWWTRQYMAQKSEETRSNRVLIFLLPSHLQGVPKICGLFLCRSEGIIFGPTLLNGAT